MGTLLTRRTRGRGLRAAPPSRAAERGEGAPRGGGGGARSAPGRGRRGVMLALSLWLIVVLTLMTSSLLSSLMLQTRLMSLRKNEQVAEGLARAGLAKAVADLRNDLLFDNAEESTPFDAEGDVWKRPEEGKFEVEYGRGFYTVEVIDEESRINVNKATPDLLAALMMILGYEEQSAKEAAAAILDWRDADNRPALSSKAADAKEGQVYALLYQGHEANEEFALDDVEEVRIKNDWFNTLDELLDVYGITPEIYYGPGSLEAEIARLEKGDRFGYPDGRFEIKKRSSRRRGDEPPVGLRDCLTVYSNGALNINTAGETVLAAVLKAAKLGGDDPEDSARRIIAFRRDRAEKDITNNKAFRRLQDADESGEIGFRLSAASSVCELAVRSQNFTIRSTGRLPDGQVGRTIELTVSRTFQALQRSESFEEMDRERRRGRDNGSWFFQPAPGRSVPGAKSERKTGPDEQTVLWPAVHVIRWLDP